MADLSLGRFRYLAGIEFGSQLARTACAANDRSIRSFEKSASSQQLSTEPMMSLWCRSAVANSGIAFPASAHSDLKNARRPFAGADRA